MLIVVLTTILSSAPVSDLINKCSICLQSCSSFIFSCSAFHLFHEKFLCANHTVINPLFTLCTVFWHVTIPAPVLLLMDLLAAFHFSFNFPRGQTPTCLLRVATADQLMWCHTGSHSEPHSPGHFSPFLLLVATMV